MSIFRKRSRKSSINSYVFPQPYDYTLNYSWFTCKKCERIARIRLSGGGIADRCEHCGHPAYFDPRGARDFIDEHG